jgi:hypothetical protein
MGKMNVPKDMNNTPKNEEKINEICKEILSDEKNSIKNIVKWLSTTHNIFVPEFLGVEDHAKTRFLKYRENDKIGLEYTTYCSIDKLIINIESNISPSNIEQIFINPVIIDAKFNIVCTSANKAFSTSGGFENVFNVKTIENMENIENIENK